jgi:hypothetical protein
MRDVKDGTVFARKIIFGMSTSNTEIIENEANAISKLWTPGAAVGVVEFLRHGWFSGEISSWYYIDMEYCPRTLEHWVRHAASAGEPTWHGSTAEMMEGASDLGDLHRIHVRSVARTSLQNWKPIERQTPSTVHLLFLSL